MAVDSYGTQNQPQFDGTKASNLASDLNAISNYAVKIGNRKVGTHAARIALTGADLWDGLEFYETDQTDGLHDTYVYDGGTSAWQVFPVTGAVQSTGLFNLATGWGFTYSTSTGTQEWFKVGGRVEFYFSFFRTSSTGISVPTDGNLKNINVGTFTVPPVIIRAFPSGAAGRIAHFTVDAGGNVQLTAVTPGSDIGQGDSFSFAGSYTY